MRVKSKKMDILTQKVCLQVDGKPVGPQRVWPGGLAMGRTIGDASAGAVVTCEPEVRQVSPSAYLFSCSLVHI